MKVSELLTLLDATLQTTAVSTEKEITCGYACDLLSWVMAHGEEGMAWVTVQTHMNVIAVASLAEMACVILPESIDMDADSIAKANEEGLCVLKSAFNTYEICGRMASAGIPGNIR